MFLYSTLQINPRSFGSRCLKGAEESTPRVDSSVPLIHHDPRDLGLICLVKKCKIHFRIFSDLRIQSWMFLKKRTLTSQYTLVTCMRKLPVIHFKISLEIQSEQKLASMVYTYVADLYQQ